MDTQLQCLHVMSHHDDVTTLTPPKSVSDQTLLFVFKISDPYLSPRYFYIGWVFGFGQWLLIVE